MTRSISDPRRRSPRGWLHSRLVIAVVGRRPAFGALGRAPSRRVPVRRARLLRPGAFVLAVVAVLTLAAPASATQPQPQQFTTIGQLTGPNTVVGTWTGAGLIDAAGTYTETARFVGSTIHAQKVLVSPVGTIVLENHSLIVWLDECTATFRAGNWHIAAASGAYAGLKGGGTPVSTPASFGNVCTGSVNVVHSGAVIID